MDESTAGVTLLSGFLFDVVGEYASHPAFATLKEKTRAFDPARPEEWAPMELYNGLCTWLEKEVGTASIQRAGENIGKRAYARMIADERLGQDATPSQILHELARVASLMIRDPKGRGWKITREELYGVRMVRTQTFNCMLQEGLLRSLVLRCASVRSVTVEHVRCTRRRDPFCEYDVRWY